MLFRSLQIVLLFLLVAAVMQPFWRGGATRVRRLPVLVDCSLSMGALDKPGGRPRLAEAKERVRQLIDGLLRDQELCLISFGNVAHKRTGFTNDKRLLREALDQIAVENVPSDIEDALRLTQALARSEPFEEVLLFSDGNFPTRAHFDLSFKLNYQKLAPAGPNFGITALSARRAATGGWDVFVQLEGAAGAETTANVWLTQNDAAAGKERVTLTPGRGERLVFRVNNEKATKLRVELQPDTFDSLAADNSAALTLPELRGLRVFVPPELKTYRQALRGLTGLEVTDQTAGTFDLVITDRAQDVALPAKSRLLVGIVPAELGGLVTLGTNGTEIVDWRRESPVLQHVLLTDLIILDRPASQPGVTEGDFEKAGYEVLAHGHRGPALVQKRAADGVTLAWLFHTDHSTLPYRAGFPIFVANVVQLAWEQAGLAEVDTELSANETTLVAADEILFNERIKVAVAGTPLKSDRDLWWALTLVALAVLAGEWWYFHRRTA